jgi:cation transport protein ChaC
VKSSIELPDLSALVFDASQHESIIRPEGDFWFFAYGSLMWNPEFEYLRRENARLHGYHRCLCLWSVEYRGSLEQPGLVMGLDRGGACVGQAYLISAQSAPEIIDKLNEREMITGAYQSSLKPLKLNSGKKVNGVCLIARQDHPQYAPGLDHQTIIDIVRKARGKRGSNIEYVLKTAHKMQELGMNDRGLKAILQALGG